MKRRLLCLFLFPVAFLFSQSNPLPAVNQPANAGSPTASQPDPQAQSRILNSYGNLPLSFEPNHGQADARVKFLSRAGSYTLFLTGDEAVLALQGKNPRKNSQQGLKPASLQPDASSTESRPETENLTADVLRMKLRKSNPAAKVAGVNELPGRTNYFTGNDPAKWRTNLPTYAKVKYQGVYSGIDLVYYGNQRQLEYDFIVSPGADPRRIQFDIHGATRIRQDEHGNLVLKMSEGEIGWHKPFAYQMKDGARQQIAAHYAITDKTHVGFVVAK
jgi:hypothetical protein